MNTKFGLLEVKIQSFAPPVNSNFRLPVTDRTQLRKPVKNRNLLQKPTKKTMSIASELTKRTSTRNVPTIFTLFNTLRLRLSQCAKFGKCGGRLQWTCRAHGQAQRDSHRPFKVRHGGIDPRSSLHEANALERRYRSSFTTQRRENGFDCARPASQPPINSRWKSQTPLSLARMGQRTSSRGLTPRSGP